MKKTLVLTIGLLAIAAGLAAYVLLVENKSAPAGPPEWQPTPVLEQGDSIDQITLVRKSDTIVLHAVPHTRLWKITQPVQAVAEPVYMGMIMHDLLQMQREKLVDLDPADLAKFQLDRPQGEIIAHYAKGAPDTRVLIGKLNYNEDHLFAKRADQPAVFLIKPAVAQYFAASLSDFRSKSLLLSFPGDILSFEIKIEDPALKATYPGALEPKLVSQSQPHQAPQWVIVSPIQENAEFQMVKQFFNKLIYVSADKVIDVPGDALAQYGLDKPAVRILFTLLNGQSEEIDFGARDPQSETVYARNKLLTQVVPVSENLFNYIVYVNFRNDKILPDLKVVNISTLSFEFPRAPAKNMVINKERGLLFSFADDPQTKVVGQRLYYVIAPFQENAVQFVNQLEPLPLQKYGLDPGDLHIKISDGEKLAMDVVLGDTVTIAGVTRTYVHDELHKTIVLLPVNLYDKIPLKKEYLKATAEEQKRVERRRRRNK